MIDFDFRVHTKDYTHDIFTFLHHYIIFKHSFITVIFRGNVLSNKYLPSKYILVYFGSNGQYYISSQLSVHKL